MYSELGLPGPGPHETKAGFDLVGEEECGRFPNVVWFVLISEHPARAQAWLLCAMTPISFSCQRFPKLSQQPFVCISVQLYLSRNKKPSGFPLILVVFVSPASYLIEGNRVANKILKAGEMVASHYD